MEPFTLPRPPADAEPGAFPLLASIAPVIGSVALFIILQTPTVLLFALLGPIIALASFGDGRRGRKRKRKAEAERWRREFAEVEAAVCVALSEREAELAAALPGARARATAPAHDPSRWRYQAGEALPVVLGVGPIASGIVLSGDVKASDPAAVRAGAVGDAAKLRSRAAVVSGPIALDARDGIGITGPAALPLARSVVLQLLESLSPEDAEIVAPEGDAWDWLDGVPYELRREPGSNVRIVSEECDVLVGIAGGPEGLPRECRVVLHAALDRVEVSAPPSAAVAAVPELLSMSEAGAAACTLRVAAERAGIAAGGGVPSAVALAELTQPTGGLAARFLVAGEPIDLDLVRDGPHAVVGGTTGSGKSELLISWVAAMAEGRSPRDVTFLLVDFKGGASFAALKGLQHSVGVMTDLDEAGARRAIESLRAELRRRERLLAEQGARDITDARGLARLVIVVDEFAAMLQELPDLHRLFVDLAARGRSLGVHLVLCTQRPAEAVRDALLANCGIRISLRVNSEQDAVAVTGSNQAAGIALQDRGRCVVRISGGATRLAQAALADPAVLSKLVDDSSMYPAPERPWKEPLPERLSLAEIDTAPHDPAGASVTLGLVDRPAKQAVEPVVWRPALDGSLLAIGSSASGRTALADLIAAGLGTSVVDREDALWDALGDDGPLVIDDVDLVFARLGDDHQSVAQQLLATAMRSGRPVALTARRVSSAMGQIAPLAEMRILLRIGSRQEHVVAGGASAVHDAELPPGAGWIADERVQLALPDVRVPRRTPQAVPLPHGPIAIVAGASAVLPAHLAGSAVPPGTPGATGAAVIAGTPAEWEAKWGELDRLRHDRPVLLAGVDLRQIRQVARGAPLPPPTRGEPVWLLEGGRCLRVAL